MDKNRVASELLKVAQDLIAIDFPSDEALKQYLNDHPKADKRNHKVVKPKLDKHINTLNKVYKDHEKRMVKENSSGGKVAPVTKDNLKSDKKDKEKIVQLLKKRKYNEAYQVFMDNPALESWAPESLHSFFDKVITNK